MRSRIAMPWLKSATFDCSFILLPSLLAVSFAFLFADTFANADSIPLWAWVVFVLGIDVSHVYSTLFRTYFNPLELKENKLMLTLIPLAVWLLGVFFYSISNMLFWRVLAYIAVFHFIRQQYGFLRIYTRGDSQTRRDRWLDKAIIYFSTLYPIVYWHGHQPRNFHWFIDGDFIVGLPVQIVEVFGWIYFATLVLYAVNEGYRLRMGMAFNVPKNAIVLGTAASWYVGIVYFNGDMIFTVTNIVAHGIPYIALVWLYGDRQKEKPDAPLILGRVSYRLIFSKAALPLFFGSLLLFGYLEEGLWAGLVWREHLQVFGPLSLLPVITAKDTLSWLVPLLTLPQSTHYVLDGFIWKMKDSEANWQKVLFSGKLGLR